MKDPRTDELLRRLAPMRFSNRPRKPEKPIDFTCPHCGEKKRATWSGPRCFCKGAQLARDARYNPETWNRGDLWKNTVTNEIMELRGFSPDGSATLIGLDSGKVVAVRSKEFRCSYILWEKLK